MGGSTIVQSQSPSPTDSDQLVIALRETARDLDGAQSDDWHEITQDAVRVLHRLAHLLENPAPRPIAPTPPTIRAFG
jgi:hypothetical protein